MWMPLFYHASSARSTPPRQVRLPPNYLLWAAEERAGLCPCRSRSESRQLLIHQTQKMQIPSMLPLLSSPLVYIFPSILDTVAPGLDGSGAFPECGTSRLEQLSVCAGSHARQPFLDAS